jgi:hypothetical protein
MAALSTTVRLKRLWNLTTPGVGAWRAPSIPSSSAALPAFFGRVLERSPVTAAGVSRFSSVPPPPGARDRSGPGCRRATTLRERRRLAAAADAGGRLGLTVGITATKASSHDAGTRQRIEKTTDGWFFGENAPDDPRIRSIECSDTRYNDIRFQTGARRVRWPQLLGQYEGRIDAEIGQTMLADTYDPYPGYINPSLRTISSHYDEDPMEDFSDPAYWWNVPFYPAGSVDAKVSTAAVGAAESSPEAHLRADCAPFDAEEFLRLHPQYTWQEGYLRSRPSQPWTLFEGRPSSS